jgi:hypothetical protein
MAAAKFSMAAAKPEVVSSLFFLCDIDAVPKAMVRFSRSANSIEVQPMIFLLRLTFNFNTATTKPEVVLTSIPDSMLTPLQMQLWVLGSTNSEEVVTMMLCYNVHLEHSRCQIQHSGRKIGSGFNFGPGCDIDVIPKAVMGFSRAINSLDAQSVVFLLRDYFELQHGYRPTKYDYYSRKPISV